MKFRYCEPTSTCVSIATDESEILTAWRHSRPNDISNSSSDILKLDVPVNEFSAITLQLYVPILIREYICSFRDHIVWARTSRVDDLTSWGLHTSAFRMRSEIEALYDSMMLAHENKEIQDDFRLKLPLAYMTHFSARFSLRGLVRLLILLNIESKRNWEYQPEMSEVFATVSRAIEISLPHSFRSKIMELVSIGAYKAPSPIVENFEKCEGFSTRISGLVFLRANDIPIALRAQLVRHRLMLFRDNFRDFLNLEGLAKPISTKMDFECALTIESAVELMRSRNCWIAQADLWSPVIEALRSALDGIGPTEAMLPCTSGLCPFLKDNDLRIENKDPNPPCPRAARLQKHKLSEEHVAAISSYAERRSDKNFWKKELASCL